MKIGDESKSLPNMVIVIFGMNLEYLDFMKQL